MTGSRGSKTVGESRTDSAGLLDRLLSQVQDKNLQATKAVGRIQQYLQDSYLSRLYNEYTSGKKDVKSQKIHNLLSVRKNALSYEEWNIASTQLDTIMGNDHWKAEKFSPLYDCDIIEFRLKQLRDARVNGNMEELLFLVRTSFLRNLGNMGDAKLYLKSFTGTKYLIEDFILECELCLKALKETKDIEVSRLLNTLVQTRKAYGRTALVLSGGSILGFLHVGVLFELLRSNLLPRIISGSSAGSIFASVLCIHLDEELEEILQVLSVRENFDIFEQTGEEESYMVRLARFLKHGTIFDSKYLAKTVKELVGDLTFQEAYNRTRRILNVTVSSASMYEVPRLLNYLTAPNVLIWSAVCASCSVPFVFSASTLLAKDPITGEHVPWTPSTVRFVDGSLDNDLPMSRLSEMFNVNHFIACQVNPHVVPFLRMSEELGTWENLQNEGWRKLLDKIQSLASDEVAHDLAVLSEISLVRNVSSKLKSVFSQQYSGDITILPELRFSELKDLFRNPPADYFNETRRRGARAIYPKMSLIRNHCTVELALDAAINELRSKMIPVRHSGIRDSVGHGRRHHYSTTNINGSFSSQDRPRERSPDLKRNKTNLAHTRRKSEGVPLVTMHRKGSWQDLQNYFHTNLNHLTIQSNGSSSRRPHWSPSLSRRSSFRLSPASPVKNNSDLRMTPGSQPPDSSTPSSPQLSRNPSISGLKVAGVSKLYDYDEDEIL